MQQTSLATKATFKQSRLKRVGKYKNCVIIDNGNQISYNIWVLQIRLKCLIYHILKADNLQFS